MLLLAALGALGCTPSGSAGLLAGRRAVRAEGVASAERLNDGLVPPVGSAWNSQRTTVFESPAAFVEFDLGAPTAVVAAALLADNNDTYEVSGSLDGVTYAPLWVAGAVSGAGLRWRSAADFGGQARFVRLRALSGDASLSVGELCLFSAPPAVLPPVLAPVSALEPGVAFRSAALWAVACVLLLVLFSSRRASKGWNGALGVAAVWGVWRAVDVWATNAPVGSLDVSLVRAAVAAVACAVVLREAFGPPRWPAFPEVGLGVLGVCAALSLLAFFNLGQPQFFDAKQGRPSAVHYYDLRVYYPVAKYFPELKYDGVYLASVAAWAEENGGLDAPELDTAKLRDLHDHQMKSVRDVRADVEAVRRRFTPQRWAAFVADLRYFWEAMGTPAYLRSMSDHGGNATPVWLAVAGLLFGPTAASESTLLAFAALDPLLLLVFAAACWRVFGARTALVALVVFGANDFTMFGSNWAGATLRNDWMVCLGLGVVALGAGRPRVAGALLAFAALIRAFPALALLGLGFPLAYGYLDARRAAGRWPPLLPFLRSQRWFVDVAIGAALFTGAAVLGSSLVLGGDAWTLWAAKVSDFTATPHTNHVSLATLLGGPELDQPQVLAERRPFVWLISLLFVGLAAWAARRRPLFAAPLLGVTLIPVLTNPANYYLHCVFLLPLLTPDGPGQPESDGERALRAKTWLVLLGLCAAQYLTVKETPWELHFVNASALLLGALALLLFQLVPRDEAGRLQLPLDEASAPPAEPSANPPDKKSRT